MAETHFLMSNTMAVPMGGGTALSICNWTSTLLQVTFREK